VVVVVAAVVVASMPRRVRDVPQRHWGHPGWRS